MRTDLEELDAIKVKFDKDKTVIGQEDLLQILSHLWEAGGQREGGLYHGHNEFIMYINL